jgi:hypothetical protein
MMHDYVSLQTKRLIELVGKYLHHRRIKSIQGKNKK